MIQHIENWFNKADPNPTAAKLNTQIGVHFEEVAEFLGSLCGEDHASQEALQNAHHILSSLADALKAGICKVHVDDRENCLKELADQIVTATGVAVYAGMNMELGLSKVIASNWSKFDRNGQPFFKENGKIAKGPDYVAPDLKECV